MEQVKCHSSILIVILFSLVCSCHGRTGTTHKPSSAETVISIEGNKFLINDSPTYKGRTWKGKPIEGLLMNSRMVQGVFDDMNPKTAKRWIYPDTKIWDADRNTNEFVKAMAEWERHGLLAVTVNLQGGSPMGYGNRG